MKYAKQNLPNLTFHNIGMAFIGMVDRFSAFSLISKCSTLVALHWSWLSYAWPAAPGNPISPENGIAR